MQSTSQDRIFQANRKWYCASQSTVVLNTSSSEITFEQNYMVQYTKFTIFAKIFFFRLFVELVILDLVNSNLNAYKCTGFQLFTNEQRWYWKQVEKKGKHRFQKFRW